MRRLGPTVIRLVTIGAFVSLCGVSAAAYTFLGTDLAISLIIGSIALMSGPTVVLALLRHSPLKGDLGPIVRYEGNALEPIGAALSLFAYVVAASIARTDESRALLASIIRTAFVGIGLGAAGAIMTLRIFRASRIPDSLKSSIAFATILSMFALSAALQPQSGLLTVTVLGLILGNQRLVQVAPFFQFRESLRLPLLSALFVLVAARLTPADLLFWGKPKLLFIATLIFLVRPAAVILSSPGTVLSWRERSFLCAFAPRGFIAAALASLFALDLTDLGYPKASQILSSTFLLIVASVALYGLGSPTLARLLKVAEASPRGVLILGAHSWAREIAQALVNAGLRVLLVDSNQLNVLAAKREGLAARCEDIFLDHTLDEVVLDGFGHFLALTANHEVNTLAALHFSQLFGPESVYQLNMGEAVNAPTDRRRQFQRRTLFGETFNTLDSRFSQGCRVRVVLLPEDYTKEALQDRCGKDSLPLFSITPGNDFRPIVADGIFRKGWRVVMIVHLDEFRDFPAGGKVIPLDRTRPPRP